MKCLQVTGGQPLTGQIEISGAKNAALPLMAASLMSSEDIHFSHMPSLADTHLMADLLSHLGKTVTRSGTNWTLSSEASHMDAPYELVSKMRASILVMGPLLARFGHARVSLPGGCAIGSRPVDLHIKAMQQMGATVELADGYVLARAPQGLSGCRIDFPFISVGATENAMMAAALASGQTELHGAAREPEILDLARCLNAMGARISGAGTDVIIIDGVTALGGAAHRVIADRVEAGSYAIGAALCSGTLHLTGIESGLLDSLITKMRLAGIDITPGDDSLHISSDGRYGAVDIDTQPYPGFPTDLQAQFMAMMCFAEGQSVITETIFENRFMHVAELMRMGAQIEVEGRRAIVTGMKELKAAPVRATDLRASVSLVLAALAAQGQTVISDIYHLDRGYADLEAKLRACGAILERCDG